MWPTVTNSATMSLRIGYQLSFVLPLVAVLIVPTTARNHTLKVENDDRPFITLTTFGFYQGGLLEVEMTDLTLTSSDLNNMQGLLLQRSNVNYVNPNRDSLKEFCQVESLDNMFSSKSLNNLIVFQFNFLKKSVTLSCSPSMVPFYIFDGIEAFHSQNQVNFEGTNIKCNDLTLPILNGSQPNSFKIKFIVYIKEKSDEGLYKLYYLNCLNYAPAPKFKQSFAVTIVEKNANDNYLSAGSMPLPSIYFMMSVIYFLTCILWVNFLYRNTHPVYKIHYLMALLVFLKATTLFFHGLNYQIIQVKGQEITTWAFIYYTIHLLKGLVLFFTIVLIGTGMTFVKHVLSDKDKNIFMIVIPLQVLANIFYAIIQESEVGDVQYYAWFGLFLIVDFSCCIAILLPITWSLKHLREASQTDGKAALNLRKLKLFQQFYIWLIAYIYFTHLIIKFLRDGVLFQFEWLVEFVNEAAMFVFFVMTGYKFRPTLANPYFQVSSDIDDDDIDVVISHFGSGVNNRSKKKTVNKDIPENEILLEDSL